MKKIGLFCASASQLDGCYIAAAQVFGQWLGEAKYTLVYGGCNLGLMEVVAKATRTHGGKVIGVIPDIIEARSCMSEQMHEVIMCQNLSQRKDIITEQSDLIVALPGGVGTLDEIFSVVASNAIGYHQKRVLLYNVEGFWDELIETLHGMARRGFLTTPFEKLFLVANTWEELKQVLQK